MNDLIEAHRGVPLLPVLCLPLYRLPLHSVTGLEAGRRAGTVQKYASTFSHVIPIDSHNSETPV